MKTSLLAALSLLLLVACHQPAAKLVEESFADSLIDHYSLSADARMTRENLTFWQQRMAKTPDNFVNGPEYAQALIRTFRLDANISDLKTADSLMRRSDEANHQQEPGILKSRAYLAILQHRFGLADSFLHKAESLEGRTKNDMYLEFDIRFELGQVADAGRSLASARDENSYAWLFRRSKLEHYDGSLTRSIGFMMQAAEKANNNVYLKQAALSNAADLCIHKGDIAKAAALYRQCILSDPADMHSVAGLGWIALTHDHNDPLAERLFNFARQHTSSPDVLLKLVQLQEARRDTVKQRQLAQAFADSVTQPLFGSMYTKYLIDLYTGILRDPAKAVQLAEQETHNRPTPQVFAWYAWSLYCDQKPEKAYAVFRSLVSGKPLEGPELYQMGMMLRGMMKHYDAKQYLNAAWENRYDLSPAKTDSLRNILQ